MSEIATTTPSSPAFALTLGMLDADTPLGMSTKAVRDFYKNAIQPLTIPFDEDYKNIPHVSKSAGKKNFGLWIALRNGEYHQYSRL